MRGFGQAEIRPTHPCVILWCFFCQTPSADLTDLSVFGLGFGVFRALISILFHG